MSQIAEIAERMIETCTVAELVEMFPEFQEGAAEHGDISVREGDLRLAIVALEALDEAGILNDVAERTRQPLLEAVRRLKTAVVVQTKRTPKAS